MADFARLSLAETDEGATTERKLEPTDNDEDNDDDEEEEEDELEDQDGGEGEAIGGGGKKKKKKKKKSKKKKKGGGTPSQLSCSRLLGGYTDYYIKYGQTLEPTIPVADLFKDGTDRWIHVYISLHLFHCIS